MASTIKRKVFENHFRPFCSDPKLPYTDRLQIEWMIDYVLNGVHPIASVSIEMTQRIKDYTGVDVSILNIEGITTPSRDKMFSEKDTKEENTNSVPHNPSDSTCCKHFSLNENLSSNYSYANTITAPTCSHSKAPYGIYCIAGSQHSGCPYNEPDTGHYADVVDQDNNVKYKVTYQRTVMGNVHFYVTNSDNNLINTFSYFANEHQAIPKDQFANELASILSEIDSMATAKQSKLNIVYPIKEEQNTSVISYISTLIPEKV